MEENKQIPSDTIPELATEKNILGRWAGFFKRIRKYIAPG